MEYRFSPQPGCGGCLTLPILLFLAVMLFPGLLKVLASLPLILIGLFFAFTYYIQRRVSAYEASQTEIHRRFVVLLIRILVKIAEADGHFTKAELRAILNFFQYNLNYSQDQMYWVKQVIQEARDTTTSLDRLLQEFRESFNYEARLILLELIYQLVHTKQPPDSNELRMARDIARVLEIDPYDLRTIEAKYMYGSYHRQGGGFGGYSGESASGGYSQGRNGETDLEARYYAVLGLEKGAGMEEIKKAYRKLCLQYHPDKVGHLGEEFKRVAEEKMKEINVAYNYFEKKFR